MNQATVEFRHVSKEYGPQGAVVDLSLLVPAGDICVLVGPSGCEITGVCFTPDRSTVFVNVQHPGEVASHPRAPKDAAGVTLTDNAIARNPTSFSTWPAESGVRPRSATVAVRRSDAGPVAG